MLSQTVWLSLKIETRRKIAVLLGLRRSGTNEVVHDGLKNRVVSDGYTPSDLMAVTLEKLQDLMRQPKETDFYKLWEQFVSQVEQPPVELETGAKTPENKEKEPAAETQTQPNQTEPESETEEEGEDGPDKPEETV